LCFDAQRYCGAWLVWISYGSCYKSDTVFLESHSVEIFGCLMFRCRWLQESCWHWCWGHSWCTCACSLQCSHIPLQKVCTISSAVIMFCIPYDCCVSCLSWLILQILFLGHLLRDDLINPVKMSVLPSVRTSVRTYVRMKHNAATNQILVFVKVDETFTMI